MIIGIMLRLIYVTYTPITIRQHDMEEKVGHLAYIETIYKTGILLCSPNNRQKKF